MILVVTLIDKVLFGVIDFQDQVVILMSSCFSWLQLRNLLISKGNSVMLVRKCSGYQLCHGFSQVV